MATHDYVIANQTTPSFRSDLNNALNAIATNNSSSTAPSTTFAGMWWFDTTNNYLKIRDKNDAAWIIVGEFDVTNSRFKLISDSLKAASASGIDILNSSGTKIIDLVVASQATAEAGTNNTELMTPLRVKQAIDNSAPAAAKHSQNNVSSTNISSTSFVDLVTTSISPSTNTTKLMVTISGSFRGFRSSTELFVNGLIAKDSTDYTASEVKTGVNFRGDGSSKYDPAWANLSTSFIVEPATTSSVTLKFRAKSNTASAISVDYARITVHEI